MSNLALLVLHPVQQNINCSTQNVVEVLISYKKLCLSADEDLCGRNAMILPLCQSAMRTAQYTQKHTKCVVSAVSHLVDQQLYLLPD